MIAAGPNADNEGAFVEACHFCIHDWGQLWAYSAFQFEGMNDCIKLFHGSRNTSKEVGCCL